MKNLILVIHVVLVVLNMQGQAFLNGSFENHTTTTNLININNATYTAAMNNSSAFGTFGNMDIITTCTWGCPTYGNWFVSLTGNGTDAISMELSQNLVNGNTYSFTFYDRKNSSYQCTPVQIGVSTSPTTFGTLVWTASAAATNSVWTQRTVTFTAPNNGAYITVKQQGGTTGYWVHIDNFEFLSYAPTVEAEYLCYGDFTQFTIDSTGFDSVYWNFDDTISGSSNYSNLEAPTHQFTDTGTFNVQLVTYLDSNVDTTYHPVYIYPRQTADLGNDTALCVGSELPLSVEQPFAEYEWSNGSTDSAIVITSDSVVIVTVYGICDTVMDTINIDWLLPFIVDLGNDTNLCTYDVDTIQTGLSSSLGFSWNTGNSQSSQLVNDTGVYSVTVTNGICTYSDTVHYGYYPEVSVELGNDSSFCYVNNAQIVPVTQNALTYVWSDGSVASTLNVGTSNDYLITVYGVGGNCLATDEVHWDFWFEPLVDLGSDTSFCHNDVLVLDPWTQSAFPMEYRWNDNSTDTTKGVNLIGLYWVEVSDENCAIRDTILVDRYPILEVDLGEDKQVCEDQTIELKPIGSQPLVNFEWNDGSTTSTLRVQDHGTYSVTVNNGLCEARDDINVFVFEYPVVELGNDTAVCLGDRLTLDATIETEIINYQWFDGVTSPSRQFTPTGKEEVWVEVTNVACSTTDTILLDVRKVESIGLINDTVICPNEEIALNANDNFSSIVWSTGDSTNSLTVSDTGKYVVVAFDGTCSTFDSVHVSHKEVPTKESIEFQVPNEICIGESFFIENANELVTAFQWQDGSTSSSYLIESEGDYWVKAYHECGVIGDSITIVPCECPIYLPNTFNPNGNGRNDHFGPQSDCAFSDYMFRVFDRWGELMFESTVPGQHWDGSYRGVEAPPGAYAWILEYKATHERSRFKEALSGQVLLLK